MYYYRHYLASLLTAEEARYNSAVIISWSAAALSILLSVFTLLYSRRIWGTRASNPGYEGITLTSKTTGMFIFFTGYYIYTSLYIYFRFPAYFFYCICMCIIFAARMLSYCILFLKIFFMCMAHSFP